MTDAPLRVACVGASLTFGLGLPNRREQCYPAVLARLLGDGYKVRNFGYAGAAAMRASHEPYWKTVSYASATRFAPELTILCLGTNDAQVVNVSKLAEFEEDLAALAEHFAGLAEAGKGGGGVLLATPPPVFEPLPEIDVGALDTIVRPGVMRVAERHAYGWIDFYEPLRDRPDLFPDNLHPDAEGAAILAGVAFAAVGAWEARRRA